MITGLVCTNQSCCFTSELTALIISGGVPIKASNIHIGDTLLLDVKLDKPMRVSVCIKQENIHISVFHNDICSQLCMSLMSTYVGMCLYLCRICQHLLLQQTICFCVYLFAYVESYTTITLPLGMTYPPHSDFTLYNLHFIQTNFTINFDGQLWFFCYSYVWWLYLCKKLLYKSYKIQLIH